MQRVSVLLAAAAGCSGNPLPSNDAGHPETRHFVISEMTILERDDIRAFDLNGDGIADNQLGALPNAVSEKFNGLISSGFVILLVELIDVESPVDDPKIGLRVYGGQDKDGNPSNNFTGSEHFNIDHASLDPDGEPLLHSDSSLQHGSFVVDFGQATVTFFGIPLTRVHITASLLENQSELNDGVLAAGISIGTLANTGGVASENLLKLLAVNLTTQPDLDNDDDGLETLVDTDGDTIIDRCIDGDGTAIDGIDCVHDPRIADGFSTAFGLAAVRCTIDCNPSAGPCPK